MALGFLFLLVDWAPGILDLLLARAAAGRVRDRDGGNRGGQVEHADPHGAEEDAWSGSLFRTPGLK